MRETGRCPRVSDGGGSRGLGGHSIGGGKERKGVQFYETRLAPGATKDLVSQTAMLFQAKDHDGSPPGRLRSAAPGRLTLSCLPFVLAGLVGCSGGEVGKMPGEPDEAGGGENGAGGAGGAGPPSKPTEEPNFDPRSGLTCDPKLSKAPAPRIWRLTSKQLANTMTQVLGTPVALPAEFFKAAATTGFSNGAFDLRVRETEAGQLRSLVQAQAKSAVEARFDEIFPCGEAKAKDANCVDAFVESFGEKAFRRPLEAAETERFRALYDAGVALGPRLGVRAVVEAMLQSPKFLFRTELGEGSSGKQRLSPYEIASALAYQLTNAPPDEALLRAAKDGDLDEDEGVKQQAKRLLDEHPDARGAVAEFFLQLMEYENLATADRDPELFPDWEGVRNDLEEETRLFVEDVVFQGGGKLDTLLTAPYTFMNGNVAKLYGANVTGAAFKKQSLNDQQRAGLLTQAGLMAQLAVFERTSPVNRGRWVRERLLCQVVPDPPPDVDQTVPDLAEGLTRRQQLEEKTKPTACANCHALMNDLGFGLENLDAVGRWRTEENGKPVDARGELTDTRDANGAFEGPVQLARKLAGSAQVRECLTVQMARYHFGRFESEADGCVLKSAHEAFAEAGFDVRTLALSLVTSEAFLYRQK